MIRYYLAETLHQLAASRCEHPALARLRGRGPWAASDHPGCVVLQRGHAASWGEIKPGIGGLRYQLAEPLPPLLSVTRITESASSAIVDLPGGVRLPVKLAAFAPVAIGLDDKPEGPSDDYGQTANRLWDRFQSGEMLIVDPQLIDFCRMALMSLTDLTPELIHAYGLLTTETIPQIFDAANGVPKKTGSDGGL